MNASTNEYTIFIITKYIIKTHKLVMASVH